MEKKNIKEELREYRFTYGLQQKIPCSNRENKKYQELTEKGEALPQGIFAYVYDYGEGRQETSKTEFYSVQQENLTEAEIAEYLTYKQLNLLTTVKNCLMFLATVTAIGLAAGILISLAL